VHVFRFRPYVVKAPHFALLPYYNYGSVVNHDIRRLAGGFYYRITKRIILKIHYSHIVIVLRAECAPGVKQLTVPEVTCLPEIEDYNSARSHVTKFCVRSVDTGVGGVSGLVEFQTHTSG